MSGSGPGRGAEERKGHGLESPCHENPCHGGRSFRSDNNAGLCPEAARALAEAGGDGAGHAVGYGDDEWTARAVAAMTEPWERVICHGSSHWNEDESTAPERITLCRTAPVSPEWGDGTKIGPPDVERASATAQHGVHHPAPGVVTISMTTEFGTAYTPEETRAVCDAAHAAGYRVHVDGARFANAAARVAERKGWSGERAARALTVEAGVDVLSFGGTKNGMGYGEAVVFLPRGDGAVCTRAAARFPYLRKSTGHLLSKHRFVSAPFGATVGDGSWLRHAAHANAMASRLEKGLRGLKWDVAYEVGGNAVFVRLSAEQHARLQAKGHGYYLFGAPEKRVARLMCSWDTTEEDVDALLRDAAG